MKKSFLALIAGLFVLTGWFKDVVHIDADTTAVFAMALGGTDSIAGAPLNLENASDSVTFYMSLGLLSPYSPTKDVSFQLSVDDAARVSYNAAFNTSFEKLPDSLYSLTDTSGTLAAGYRSTSAFIKVYSGKADLTKSYMLPVRLKSAQGHNIDSKKGILYLNYIGTPVSGRFTVTGTRTDYVGPKSGNNISDTVDLSTLPVKITQTQSTSKIYLDYADLGLVGWQYIINYDLVDKTISVTPNNLMLGAETGVLPGSFVIDVADWNAATGVMHLKTEYTDLSGNARVVDEYLTRK